MDKTAVDELVSILGKYSIEDIRTALENAQPAEKTETAPVKKKRGRPKKTDKKENTFIDEGPQTEEEKRIAEVSKQLIANKSKVANLDKRPTITMVNVTCRNCGRQIELPSNFPDLTKFICCNK